MIADCWWAEEIQRSSKTKGWQIKHSCISRKLSHLKRQRGQILKKVFLHRRQIKDPPWCKSRTVAPIICQKKSHLRQLSNFPNNTICFRTPPITYEFKTNNTNWHRLRKMRKEQKYWRVGNSGLCSDLGSSAGSGEQSQVDHVWPRAAKVIRFSWKHISYFLLFKFFVRALFGLMNSLNLFSCDGFHLGEDEITHATVTFSQ